MWATHYVNSKRINELRYAERRKEYATDLTIDSCIQPFHEKKFSRFLLLWAGGGRAWGEGISTMHSNYQRSEFMLEHHNYK